MAEQRISYNNKVGIQSPAVSTEKQVRAEDLNEIKSVVNNNANEFNVRESRYNASFLNKTTTSSQSISGPITYSNIQTFNNNVIINSINTSNTSSAVNIGWVRNNTISTGRTYNATRILNKVVDTSISVQPNSSYSWSPNGNQDYLVRIRLNANTDYGSIEYYQTHYDDLDYYNVIRLFWYNNQNRNNQNCYIPIKISDSYITVLPGDYWGLNYSYTLSIKIYEIKYQITI